MLFERKKQWSCSSLLNLGKAQRVDMGNSTWNLTQFKFQVKTTKKHFPAKPSQVFSDLINLYRFD